jgi:uncharacterized phage infection (PIP) family protein YhgE
MEYIKIPAPDFNFEDIAKQKAEEIGRHILYDNGLLLYVRGGNHELESRLQEEVLELYDENERLICIKELLNHLTKVVEGFRQYVTYTDEDVDGINKSLNKIRYILYSLAKSTTGYTFDRNAFTNAESNELDSKINGIIEALNRLQAGQEVLYNQFEEVREQIKADFELLKTDKPLGKKRFIKIALGTIGSYTGNKVADEIFAQLRPDIVELLKHQAPHLLEGFSKMFING